MNDKSDTGNLNQAKVALWNIPRSASTVLTKCLSSIDGIEVYFELYTTCSIFRRRFLEATGRELPDDIMGNEEVYEEAKMTFEKKCGFSPSPGKITYQQIKENLENSKSRYVFSKGNFKGLDTIDTVIKYLPSGFRHTFVIREPSEMFVSARKACRSRFVNESSESEEEFDFTRQDPTNHPIKLYEQLHQLWRYVKENGIDASPVVIDASDLWSRPRATMKAYCEAVGFPFSDDILQWESNLTRMSDNVVTPSENYFEACQEFYRRALQSTRFLAPLVSGPIPRDQLTNDVIQCVDHSMPFYREMYEHRLRPLTNMHDE